ncbi:hypothetical protein K3495_g11628 [Podosphaera aphanis]|nr:hypothetical protein K3495_g11628 [Podosphaera aphanis]
MVALSAPRTLASPTTRAVDTHILHIPTAGESAILARRILRHTPLGVFSTVYPTDANAQHQRPGHRLENTPVGLMEYIADCEVSGNPTILAISIATTFQNVASGSNISLSLTWRPPYAPSARISTVSNPYAYSAANLPRFSLFGYLEQIEGSDVEKLGLEDCFIKSHPDAKLWLPKNHIHASIW